MNSQLEICYIDRDVSIIGDNKFDNNINDDFSMIDWVNIQSKVVMFKCKLGFKNYYKYQKYNRRYRNL